MTTTTGEASEDQLGTPTVAATLCVTVGGFSAEEEAREVGIAVRDCVILLSRHFNLSRLDGVTVAHDYLHALASLDRGYKTNHVITPSDGHAVGVAMTPSVLREGTLMSHIVFNAHIVAPITKPDPESIQLPLHVIAHECAHVEITHKFDEAFPGVLLRQRHGDAREAFRWQVILACWDEYAATRLSANFGEDPTDGYEETFLKHMAEARSKARAFIHAYRRHGNVDQVYAEVYGVLGDVLKFAAYVVGNADGHQVEVAERAALSAALAGHWFEPFFRRLHEACRALGEQHGRWTGTTLFEVIGDIADEVVALCGIKHCYLPDGRLYLDIP
ncbi:MAG: hypothetical protein KIT60_20560 [Burkholderiaceae bacterium]|nr:hypothetical protein [Burkholderiaceae bacterium]